jgi:hypothetical protein
MEVWTTVSKSFQCLLLFPDKGSEGYILALEKVGQNKQKYIAYVVVVGVVLCGTE